MYKILRRVCKVSRNEMFYKLGTPLIEVSAWSIVLFVIIFFLILSSNSNILLSDYYLTFYLIATAISDFLLLFSAIKIGIRKRTGYTEITIAKESYLSFLNPLKILRIIVTSIEK